MIVILSLVYLALLMGLFTAGATLCVHYWCRNLPQRNRIVLAAFLGPACVFIVPLGMNLLAGNFAGSVWLVGSVALVLAFLVGLPMAIGYTRNLDKRLRPDAKIFE